MVSADCPFLFVYIGLARFSSRNSTMSFFPCIAAAMRTDLVFPLSTAFGLAPLITRILKISIEFPTTAGNHICNPKHVVIYSLYRYLITSNYIILAILPALIKGVQPQLSTESTFSNPVLSSAYWKTLEWPPLMEWWRALQPDLQRHKAKNGWNSKILKPSCTFQLM